MGNEDKVIHLDDYRATTAVSFDIKTTSSIINQELSLPHISPVIGATEYNNVGTMKVKEHSIDMEHTYSKTEIDSKIDLVNQKIEHNQKTMELILLNGLNEIKSQIKSELDVFKSDINGEVKSIRSDIKGDLKCIQQEVFNLKWIIGVITIPLGAVIWQSLN